MATPYPSPEGAAKIYTRCQTTDDLTARLRDGVRSGIVVFGHVVYILAVPSREGCSVIGVTSHNIPLHLWLSVILVSF